MNSLPVMPSPVMPLLVIVERILSIPVSLLQDSKYSVWNTTIWNTCYLECFLFGILSYSTGFTKFHWFHSLPIYYRITYILQDSQCNLEQNHFSFHHKTFNNYPRCDYTLHYRFGTWFCFDRSLLLFWHGRSSFFSLIYYWNWLL